MTPTSRDINNEATVPDNALTEPLDGLGIELGRISAEIQSINSGFQAQMQQVFSEVRASIENEYRIRFDKSLEILREQIRIQVKEELHREFEEDVANRLAQTQEVQKEIERITIKLEGCAKEIIAMLDDPSVELSKVMRKRTEQAELKAYLDGLRFSMSLQAKAQGTAGK